MSAEVYVLLVQVSDRSGWFASTRSDPWHCRECLRHWLVETIACAGRVASASASVAHPLRAVRLLQISQSAASVLEAALIARTQLHAGLDHVADTSADIANRLHLTFGQLERLANDMIAEAPCCDVRLPADADALSYAIACFEEWYVQSGKAMASEPFGHS